MKHNCSYILVAALLIGCVKVKKKDGEQSAPQQIQNEQQMKSEIQSNHFEKLDIQYINNQVEFQIPESWPAQLVVETVLKDSTNKFQIKIEKNKIWTNSIPADEKITYRFFARGDNDEELLGTISVLPVFNMELTENFNLAQKYKIDSTVQKIYFKKLKLEKNARLLVENFSGILKIDNLVAEGGFLQTFELGQKAASDTLGRSGGKVQIEIVQGTGELNIFMLGENGGNGSPGQSPDEALRGERGQDSVPAVFSSTSCLVQNPFYTPNCYVCTEKPTEPTSGGSGLKGYSGKNGKNGGDSGSVHVYVVSKDLKVNLFNREGRRGERGLGGRGGSGGFAGLAGDGNIIDFIVRVRGISRSEAQSPASKKYLYGAEISNPCNPASTAKQGAEGEPGDSGIDGNDGLILKSEIFLNKEKSTFNNETN